MADEGAGTRGGSAARRARGRALTIERQSLKGDAPEVTIIGPTGASSKAQLVAAEPGLSRTTIDVDQLGLYRISDGEHQALVNVGPDNPLEFREVVSTMEKLRPLAEATGGTVRRIAAGDGDAVVMPRIIAMHELPSYGGADYIGVKRTGSSVIVGVASTPLGVGFLGLAAACSARSFWSGGGRGQERRHRAGDDKTRSALPNERLIG